MNDLDVVRAQSDDIKLTKWKTKDGKKIPIEELSDRHLFNIIKMLDGVQYEHWRSVMIEEAKRRGIWEL